MEASQGCLDLDFPWGNEYADTAQGPAGTVLRWWFLVSYSSGEATSGMEAGCSGGVPRQLLKWGSCSARKPLWLLLTVNSLISRMREQCLSLSSWAQAVGGSKILDRTFALVAFHGALVSGKLQIVLYWSRNDQLSKRGWCSKRSMAIQEQNRCGLHQLSRSGYSRHAACSSFDAKSHPASMCGVQGADLFQVLLVSCPSASHL
jgi:hypothetical protein